MKTLLFSALFCVLSLVSFGQQSASTSKPLSFGEKISPAGAISTDELMAKMAGKEKLETKVEGKIVDVCQAKGCWATMKLPDGKTMRVRFKDYAFFVPKNSGGKTMIMEGTAFVKEVPISELQHYAKDAGASQEEVAKITEPERSLAFEAKGVLIKP